MLHYVDSEIFGGSEEAALQLMGGLDRSRWEPVLLHHPGAGLDQLVEGAARLGIRRLTVSRIEPGARLAGTLRLRRAIRAEAPAIFHAHLSWPLACRHGVLAAWLARVPGVLGTAQLYVHPGSARRTRYLLAPLHRIIAVSSEVARRYTEELGVPAARLAVVPNAVSVPDAPPPANAELRSKLLGRGPAFLVLTAARLHEQKGHTYLLQAARQVPEATFVLAGEGPLRAELEAEAAALGLGSRCVFLGQRTDVAGLLAAVDLFVLPSLYEGLPVSVLEAMAACRPVVATAIGGTIEAVEHEVTGLLVPPRDPAALAAAIRRLQGDPALAARLAAAGRARVEREFSVTAAARAVMAVYDQLAPDPPAAGRHA